MSRNSNGKTRTPLLTHLVAGGAAGFMEACTCHPLDTIKVRMQLSKTGSRNAAVKYIIIITTSIHFINGMGVK
jgi:solute carrier family 25 citrate transporter 1